MTEEERRRRRRARKLRAMGRPQSVYPHELAEATEIARRAHAAGMTCKQIEEQVGLGRTTVQPIIRGERKTISRRNYEKLLTLKIVVDTSGGRTRHHGAIQNSTGTRRRLQALGSLGFSTTPLGAFLDAAPSQLRAFMRGMQVQCYAAFAHEVRELYDKYSDVDPVDLGYDPVIVRRMRAEASAKRWAPPSAWDEDTIDDPQAFPQWTGACGTAEGRAIHRREGIPMCPACRSPRDDSFSYGVFSPDRMLAWQRTRRLNRRELAEAAHLSPDTIDAYTIGKRVPPTSTLERLADALRCHPEDLVD